MLKTFVTNKIIDGERFEGENITAESFEEAEAKAKELGLIVLGHLEDDTEF
jgi:hypothetical protein